MWKSSLYLRQWRDEFVFEHVNLQCKNVKERGKHSATSDVDPFSKRHARSWLPISSVAETVSVTLLKIGKISHCPELRVVVAERADLEQQVPRA